MFSCFGNGGMVWAYSMYTTKVFGIKDKTTSQKALSCSTISTFETHLESHSWRKKLILNIKASPVSAKQTEPGSNKD